MDHAKHAHVPVGTLHDHHSAGPKTITRDYSHALIPALELDVAGIDLLASILPGLRADMVAAEAEEAAEAAEATEDEVPPEIGHARQRAAELFALSDDPNWLGI